MNNWYRVGALPLLAGEYPFARNPAEGARKLAALLDAGATRFIDLTEPADGMRPYAAALAEESRVRGRTFTRVSLGVPDMGVPARERMTEILDAIDAAIAAGETPYVHCWGGVGRTGTVVGCYLVRRGMTGREALRTVGELFATMSPAKVLRHQEGSPQTESQQRFVLEWTEPVSQETSA